jgi:hypothetical protein
MVALLIAGCGGGGASTAGTTAQQTATGPVTQTVPSRTAADDLAPYFSAAQSLSQQLAAAAVLINSGIHANTMSFDQTTLDAITAIDPSSAAKQIPAGIPPDLLRAVLRVQSELVSRRAAFNTVTSHPTDRPYVLSCLANGAPAAARFAGDLAAARSLAARTPPIAVAGPTSRPAADLAIYLQYFEGVNMCCGSCGGVIATELPVISWVPPTGRTWAPPHGWNGTLKATPTSTETLPFSAQYLSGKGWSVQFAAG